MDLTWLEFALRLLGVETNERVFRWVCAWTISIPPSFLCSRPDAMWMWMWRLFFGFGVFLLLLHCFPALRVCVSSFSLLRFFIYTLHLASK